jgi:hypothetical protein
MLYFLVHARSNFDRGRWGKVMITLAFGTGQEQLAALKQVAKNPQADVRPSFDERCQHTSGGQLAACVSCRMLDRFSKNIFPGMCLLAVPRQGM